MDDDTDGERYIVSSETILAILTLVTVEGGREIGFM